MSIENFIKEALFQPNDYIAYHVGRELAELHPGKAIIEGRIGYFDLEAFVRAEKCSVVEQKSIFHHVKTEWESTGKKFRDHIENSWLNVLWGGQLLNVILITWVEDCYRRRHHWIIADEKKIAEQFFDAVCEWCWNYAMKYSCTRTASFKKATNSSRQSRAQRSTTLFYPSR